jgi:hypothetical protein
MIDTSTTVVMDKFQRKAEGYAGTVELLTPNCSGAEP